MWFLNTTDGSFYIQNCTTALLNSTLLPNILADYGNQSCNFTFQMVDIKDVQIHASRFYSESIVYQISSYRQHDWNVQHQHPWLSREYYWYNQNLCSSWNILCLCNWISLTFFSSKWTMQIALLSFMICSQPLLSWLRTQQPLLTTSFSALKTSWITGISNTRYLLWPIWMKLAFMVFIFLLIPSLGLENHWETCS